MSVLNKPRERGKQTQKKSNIFIQENRKFDAMATPAASDIRAEGEEQKDL